MKNVWRAGAKHARSCKAGEDGNEKRLFLFVLTILELSLWGVVWCHSWFNEIILEVRGESKCEGKYFPNSGDFQHGVLPKFVVVYLLTPRWRTLTSTCLPLSLCKPLSSTAVHIAKISTCFLSWKSKPFICSKPGCRYWPPVSVSYLLA